MYLAFLGEMALLLLHVLETAKRCYSGHKFLALNGRKNTLMDAKSLKKSQ